MHTSDEKALAQEMLEKYESDSRFRQFKGKMAVFITALAVIWGLFQLYVSSFGVMDAIIRVHLGLGEATATAWGSDLTEGYVHINASYRS